MRHCVRSYLAERKTGIYAASKKAFVALGDQCSNWQEKIIALGADGAANLGSKGGVITLLQQEAGDHIVPFHCMPHRLELAMLSVQRDNPMMGQLYDLLHLIWKTYHFSPKSMRELRVIWADLGVNVLMPSGVKGTRWLPHVSRALETFLKPGQFTAVYYHMDHLVGSSANADIAGRATKVKKSMEDATFVAFCCLIADVFSGISKLSLLLQRNEIIMEAMVARPKPSGRLSEFLADIRLQRRQQQEEGEMAIYKFQESASESDTTKAVKCFNIFNHDSWPENQEDLVDHGADDLAFLLDHFSTVLRRNGVNTELAKKEFVGLKLLILMLTREPYCSEYENILHLVHIMLVLPVSAAVYGRGFSAQKRIKSDTRASLHSDTVEYLIRISVEGPSLEDFDARESVASWFSKGQRSRRPNYRSWPSEGHVTAMEDSP
ncbi:hypothetical protein G5714_022997 [Onychostoma macrolepis]|uniref:Uncharacterized protein n=1 Tax=Onychostoma macrolepis TaxID=369639 RepID=A0A7J6BPS3_9TELE|nr:hypothetical protein G5714_022997 [Onychostoma macrolepis]